MLNVPSQPPWNPFSFLLAVLRQNVVKPRRFPAQDLVMIDKDNARGGARPNSRFPSRAIGESVESVANQDSVVDQTTCTCWGNQNRDGLPKMYSLR